MSALGHIVSNGSQKESFDVGNGGGRTFRCFQDGQSVRLILTKQGLHTPGDVMLATEHGFAFADFPLEQAKAVMLAIAKAIAAAQETQESP